MIDSADVLHRQTVALSERSPAVLPIEKFVSQAEFEFRMPAQIADRSDAKRCAASRRMTSA